VTAALAAGMTLALAAAVGLVASALGVPLPWLLGPLVAAAAVAMADLRPVGIAPRLPKWTRPVFAPVIGTAIGATVTPEILGQAAAWWPSLLAVAPFVLVVQLMNYAALRRIGGFDRPTAFFAASPGGLVDAVLIGERRGGQPAAMSTQHFARIALSVASVPLILTFAAVELGAPPPAAPAPPAPGPAGAALLLGCAVAGALAGARLRLPAGVMLGPFLASAALHLGGVTEAQVPEPLVRLAQLALGALIGLQFSGLARGALLRGLGLAALTTGLALGVAAGFALALAQVVPASRPAIFLAFAPGGVAEMGLVAISLGTEPAFVIVHHLLRIVLTIFIGALVYDRLIARGK
jgi:hypothetical protein